MPPVERDRKRKLDERGDEMVSFQPMPNPRHLGIRGLCNLGSTCFLNSVAQALLSNPLLRNYFLSEQHTRDRCYTALRNEICVACELDTLVVESFRGERTCYNPHRLLFAFWKQALSAGNGGEGFGFHLADSGQQDAHEFFVAFLNVLQSHDRLVGVDDPDNGLVDRAFRGSLRSDVQCLKCGAVSTTFETFLDLSFDLGATITSASPTGGKRGAPVATTLIECINRFTRRENLNRADTFNCPNCGTPQQCAKQLSLSRLPPVMCLHLKRFEHNKKTAKMDAHVGFPINGLDLAPFQPGHVALDHERGQDHIYDLFCVVEHKGECDAGHYVAYARHVNHANKYAYGAVGDDPDAHTDWFLFDDSCVYRSSAQVVEECQAYLLFYVRRELVYRS